MVVEVAGIMVEVMVGSKETVVVDEVVMVVHVMT